MSEGAGEALTVGWTGHARNAPVATLMLSLGPVLVPAIAGFLADPRVPGQPARTAGAGILVGLFLFYFVMLSDQFWVGFRAGQILLAMLTVPLALLLDRLLDLRRTVPAGVLVAGILVVGLPTTTVDAYNAADITNLHRSGLPLDRDTFSRRAGCAPVDQTRDSPARDCAGGTRGPGSHAVEPDSLVRSTSHGSGPADLAPAAAGDTRRAPSGGAIDLSDRARRERPTRRRGALKIDYLWVDGTRSGRAYPDGVAHVLRMIRRDSPPCSATP